MMFTALWRVRASLHAVLMKLPMDSSEATDLVNAIDDLDDAMVEDVRNRTYAEHVASLDNPVFTFCQEQR